MADPREGVTLDGLIVTGARRDRVPPVYEPVLAYVLGRVPPEVSVHVYGSVADGMAVVPTDRPLRRRHRALGLLDSLP